jgi:flagellar hook protein FlgE
MIDSIFISMSGMLGHERGLNVLSHNVANMNTVAFRGSSVSFADVFVGTAPNGLLGERGLGGGVDASRTQLDFRSGEPDATGRALDLLLKGEGFFVLEGENGEIRYTRDGRFEFLNDVLVARDQKSKVMTRNSSGQLVPLTLKDLLLNPAKATTKVSFSQNLSPGDPEHTIDQLTVFDGQGIKHTLRVVFTRQALAGTVLPWSLAVFEGSTQIGSGRLEFVGSQPVTSVLPMTLALKDTQPAQVSFDFSAVTGVSFGQNVESNLRVQEQDGFAAGTVTGTTFDANGILKITYSNGQTADGPKLALAQITDQNGLVAAGDASFVYRGAQAVTLRDAGDDLQVLSGSLERSNVDLTSEFSHLILLQRGYQASSQVLSTANEMLQQLFDLRGRR